MTIPYTVIGSTPTLAWGHFLIAALTLYNYNSVDPNLRVPNTSTEEIHPEYDFIIVGAGSAGCVLASRLSKMEDWSVLLLEAGGDETVFSDVPFLYRILQNTNLDWQYRTEPSDAACLGMEGARCAWPRGKMLGGSSTINVMLYVRGNKRDYDQWESLGNPGWGYSDVLPYFLKSEDCRIPELKNSSYHSTGGPLTVSQSSYGTPLGPAFLQAVQEMGYPIQDYNGEFQTGFMKPQWNIRDGHRCSAAKAYLNPVGDKHNLQISMYSHVTRVLINPKTKIAFGVEFVKDGNLYTVKAHKEVILSAGAINSPQILMLSGIGPKTDLQKLSIPVLQNLKVGDNLHDHVAAMCVNFVINQSVITGDKRLDLKNAVLDYAQDNSGVLTLPNFEALGNINTRFANTSDDLPDVQLAFYALLGIDTEGADKRIPKPRDAWGVYVSLNRAKSKGRLRLRSNNPFDYPILIHNYFTEPIDLLTLIEGVKIAYNTGQTAVMQRFGSVYNYTNPNCGHVPLYSDAFWECVVRYTSKSTYHPVGTCKMGPFWDQEAVVDAQLRVYGVERLRVIDASIMPGLVSGNTNAATVMIGEKGADLVKKAWLANRSVSTYSWIKKRISILFSKLTVQIWRLWK